MGRRIELERVSAELQGQGFAVLTPPNLLHGAAGDAAYVASFLAQRTTGPVVLVGHSYGGVVITNAGTAGGDVRALVFEQPSAPFPRRLLAALEAGQAAGGDARGMMAAALVVVAAEPRDPWAGRLVDLRVDRSDAPLADLRRLLDASEAYDGFHRAVGALSRGDATAALASADEGLSMPPGEQNLRFVHAGARAASGDAAGAELRELIAARRSWGIIIRSFVAKGLMTLPPPAQTELLGDRQDQTG